MGGTAQFISLGLSWNKDGRIFRSSPVFFFFSSVVFSSFNSVRGEVKPGRIVTKSTEVIDSTNTGSIGLFSVTSKSFYGIFFLPKQMFPFSAKTGSHGTDIFF